MNDEVEFCNAKKLSKITGLSVSTIHRYAVNCIFPVGSVFEIGSKRSFNWKKILRAGIKNYDERKSISG